MLKLNLKRIFQIPTDTEDQKRSVEDIRKFQVINGILALGCVFLALLGILGFLQKDYLLSILDFLFCSIFLFFIYRVRKTWNIQFYSILGMTLLLIFFFYLFIDGGVKGSAFLWIYTYPLAAIFLLGSRLGIRFSYILITLVILSYLFSEVIPFHYSYNRNIFFRLIPSYFVVVLFSWFMEKSRFSSEKSLKKAREKAESASRAKSEFLANMSHEIRTPLNAVIGFSELLSGLINDPVQKKYIKSIKISGISLLTLINDILDLSKIEAGKLEVHFAPVKLKLLLTEIEMIFRREIFEKKLKLLIDVDDKLPDTILIDETRLRQILLNMVGNAIKFTEKGYVKIIVKMEKTISEPDKFNLRILIEDTGIGIQTNDLKYIFESFMQSEGQCTRKYGGTGLGLAICRRLTEIMDGEIFVESQIGKGSIFTIHFRNIQIADEKLVNTEIDDFKITDYIFKKANILVVDDIQSNRDLLSELLTQVGLSVFVATNGSQALLMARQLKPDIIFMDLRMPVMGGNEATKILKSNPETKNIPVIALSASTQLSDFKEGVLTGFDEYLSKPVKSKKVFKTLAKYLDYDKRIDKIRTKETKIIDKPFSEELKQKLRKDMIPMSEMLLETMVINNIRKFAQELKEMGIEYKNLKLVQYSESLMENINSFNVKEIDKMMRNFSDFINVES